MATILRATTKDDEFYEKWRSWFGDSELVFLLIQRFHPSRSTLGEEYCQLQRDNQSFVWTFCRVIAKVPLIQKCLRVAFLLQIIPSPIFGVKYRQIVEHPDWYRLAGLMSLSSLLLDYYSMIKVQSQVEQTNQTNPSQGTCILCEENPIQRSETSVTKCGHVFHYGCIQEWFSEHPFCPVCRNKSTQFVKLINF